MEEKTVTEQLVANIGCASLLLPGTFFWLISDLNALFDFQGGNQPVISYICQQELERNQVCGCKALREHAWSMYECKLSDAIWRTSPTELNPL